MHEVFLTVVQKSSENRTKYECAKMVPWFKNHCQLFEQLSAEIVADVIRHCGFERKKKDDVLIKQGENGDKLYIVLKGSVSIYVIHDQKDNVEEILKEISTVCDKHDLDRTLLGQYVWSGGEGKSFGEMALLKDDCIRMATVVADCDTDLVVIDRNLYNRSVRDALEREYNLKTKFVEENMLFTNWPSKQKKLLVVALKKESAKYGSNLIRQGHPADHMYFLLSGEIEIACDQSQFKGQYEELWQEMETLLPGLVPRSSESESPHEMLRRKKAQHRLIQLCLLGSNEMVGALEVVLGLTSYLDNAMVTREVDLLLISKENYDRLFSRKYAQTTVQALRERLTMRLYLYIYRSEIYHDSMKSPFFKFLSFMLQNEDALQELRRTKRRERELKCGFVSDNEKVDPAFKHGSKEAEKISGMLKMLDVNPKTSHGRLPVVESSQRVINEIEAGLNNWIERSRGRNCQESSRTRQPVVRNKSSHGNDLLKPNMHDSKSLSRPRTPND